MNFNGLEPEPIGMTIARYGSGPMRSSVHDRARSGFTVVELMVVAIIVGVIAAAVVPALAEVRSDGRQSSAAQDIVRMGRRARAMTMETGVAHLLRFQHGNDARGSFGLGRFELFTGMNSRCRQTPWEQALDAPTGSLLGVDAARREGANVLDMSSFNPTDSATVPTSADTGRQKITVQSSWGGEVRVAVDIAHICYQPNGRVYLSTAARATGAPVVFFPMDGALRFDVYREVNGSVRGVTRHVVFPPGGNARVRY